MRYVPSFALANASLLLRLLVVELVVAGVPAASGCRDHGSGLGLGHPRSCVVPGTCQKQKTSQGVREPCVSPVVPQQCSEATRG